MIELQPAISGAARWLVLPCFSLLFLSACSEDEGIDYCQDHFLVHADHADSIAMLHGTLDAQGLLTMQLKLPASVLDAGMAGASESGNLLELLRSPEQVFSLQTDQACAPASVTVNELSQGLELEYQSHCGAGNRIKQVNVELFGLLDDLEEVEVQMDTTATAKHFAISRLCKQAIFRLNPPGQH